MGVRKTNDKEVLTARILEELKRLKLKGGHVWMEQQITTFTANLPKYLQAAFADAVSELIEQGVLERQPDKNPKALFLTASGERVLYGE